MLGSESMERSSVSANSSSPPGGRLQSVWQIASDFYNIRTIRSGFELFPSFLRWLKFTIECLVCGGNRRLSRRINDFLCLFSSKGTWTEPKESRRASSPTFRPGLLFVILGEATSADDAVKVDDALNCTSGGCDGEDEEIFMSLAISTTSVLAEDFLPIKGSLLTKQNFCT